MNLLGTDEYITKQKHKSQALQIYKHCEPLNRTKAPRKGQSLEL